jgi:hypothetical protein
VIKLDLLDTISEELLVRGPYPVDAPRDIQIRYIDRKIDKLFKYPGVEYPAYFYKYHYTDVECPVYHDNGKLVMQYRSLNKANKIFHNVVEDFTRNINDSNKKLVVHQIMNRKVNNSKQKLILLNFIRVLLMPVHTPYDKYFSDVIGDNSLFDSDRAKIAEEDERRNRPPCSYTIG